MQKLRIEQTAGVVGGLLHTNSGLTADYATPNEDHGIAGVVGVVEESPQALLPKRNQPILVNPKQFQRLI